MRVGKDALKVLAVSSGGGHWIEMQRLVPAFAGHEVHFVTVNESYCTDDMSGRFHLITDATRSTPLSLVKMTLELIGIVVRGRPKVVVSTGAAPGLIALLLSKLVGSKTIWVDSIANVDELSGSGRYAKRVADLWLTQWEHLARPDGPEFAGKVL